MTPCPNGIMFGFICFFFLFKKKKSYVLFVASINVLIQTETPKSTQNAVLTVPDLYVWLQCYHENIPKQETRHGACT